MCLSACQFPYYGDKCSKTCQCGPGSSGCDPVRGCICKVGYSGTKCDTDIDECGNTNACGDVNKICQNTFGSYTCGCRNGYRQIENSTCIGKTQP